MLKLINLSNDFQSFTDIHNQPAFWPVGLIGNVKAQNRNYGGGVTIRWKGVKHNRPHATKLCWGPRQELLSTRHHYYYYHSIHYMWSF